MKIQKCINCGANLTTSKCSYCNTDYGLHVDFAKQIKNITDSKIKGYYKILETAFDSENYDESLQYANKIIELDPENKDIWGIKIISTLNKMTIAQFEDGSAITLLRQLINTTPEYAYKILDIVFNVSIYHLKYVPLANCNALIDNACACLDRGAREMNEKAKMLISTIKSRGASLYISGTNTATYNGIYNKSTILYNLENKYIKPYLSDEEKTKIQANKEKAKKANKLAIKIGLPIIALFVLLVIGLNLYKQYVVNKNSTEVEVIDISFEKRARILFNDNPNDLPSPDIFIYIVKINDDTAKLEKAIINKIESDPAFSGSYYFYETQELPDLTKIKNIYLQIHNDNQYSVDVPEGKEYWNEICEFILTYKPIAETAVDGSSEHDKFYVLADSSGQLGRFNKLP